MIILTGHGDIDMAVESMKRGAVDCLQKPVGARTLERALASAFARARQCASDRRIRDLAAGLSEREREIAEAHRSPVVEKMGAANSAELAALWQRLEA